MYSSTLQKYRSSVLSSFQGRGSQYYSSTRTVGFAATTRQGEQRHGKLNRSLYSSTTNDSSIMGFFSTRVSRLTRSTLRALSYRRERWKILPTGPNKKQHQCTLSLSSPWSSSLEHLLRSVTLISPYSSSTKGIFSPFSRVVYLSGLHWVPASRGRSTERYSVSLLASPALSLFS